jgi:hypothetical protein
MLDPFQRAYVTVPPTVKIEIFELAAFLICDAASLRDWCKTSRNDVLDSSSTSTNHARKRHSSKKNTENDCTAEKAYKHKDIYYVYICTCTCLAASFKQSVFLVYRFFWKFWSSSREICLGFSTKLNYIQISIPYRAVNTNQIIYEKQSFKSVEGNNRCFVRGLQEADKHTLWLQRRIFEC